MVPLDVCWVFCAGVRTVGFLCGWGKTHQTAVLFAVATGKGEHPENLKAGFWFADLLIESQRFAGVTIWG